MAAIPDLIVLHSIVVVWVVISSAVIIQNSDTCPVAVRDIVANDLCIVHLIYSP